VAPQKKETTNGATYKLTSQDLLSQEKSSAAKHKMAAGKIMVNPVQKETKRRLPQLQE